MRIKRCTAHCQVFVPHRSVLRFYFFIRNSKQEDWRPSAFEMWIWRRLVKISWTQHAWNEQILGMVIGGWKSRFLAGNFGESEESLDSACLKIDVRLKKVIEGRLHRWTEIAERPRAMLLDAMSKKMKVMEIIMQSSMKHQKTEKLGVTEQGSALGQNTQ